ncbi:MAG: hypothetical protein ACXADH_00970 [Candidatus Kariarchaeaceae archaeon]
MRSLIVDNLIREFNNEEITYCHWKSNIDLTQAISGEMDLDLLVARESLQKAKSILSTLRYKQAVVRWGANPAGISHYYKFDPLSGSFNHVHLFSKVLTGESFVKSHLLPFDEMVFENTRNEGQIRVISKSAELVLFTLRIFIKYGSMIDLIYLSKNSGKIRSELNWLKSDGDLSKSLSLLNKYCPVIDGNLFIECIKTLESDASLFQRLKLARKVRKRLSIYAKYTFLERLVAYLEVVWIKFHRSFGTRKKNKVFQAGGAVIAFVGPDATGKSTLVSETSNWLGDVFAVSTSHAGKPPPTWITAPFFIFMIITRSLIGIPQPPFNKTNQSHDTKKLSKNNKGLIDLLYAIRAVALAWDRRNLIRKRWRDVANGEIVIFDRYPSTVFGAMDSPRLDENSTGKGFSVNIYNRLAAFETKIYRQIPPPDIVLKLEVSLETAKERDRERGEQDGDSYLENRHRLAFNWNRPEVQNITNINTNQTLDETMVNVKNVIWDAI